MEETQNNDSLSGVIGKRVQLPVRKSLKVYCVLLSLAGLAFFVIGVVNYVVGNLEYAPIFLVFGAVICLCGIVCIIALNKQEKVAKENADRPTVKNNGDGSLTFYLENKEEKTVKLTDIKSVKFAPRVVARFFVVVTEYKQQNDGTLVVKLNDGTKFKVRAVDEGLIVLNKILLLKNQSEKD